MEWPKLSYETQIVRLALPEARPVDMVLDTDTYNEVDDQFALCLSLLSPDRVTLRAAGRHEKEYVVDVDKPITPDFLARMAAGVPILDTVTLPCRVAKEDRQRFRIVLVQGLNRQIRRMCEALGYNVTSLRRERVMNIRLGRLKSGHWRNLTPAELEELMRQLDDE